MWKTNNQSHHELANVKIPAVNHQKATTAAQYLLQHGALLRKKELAYQRNKRHSTARDKTGSFLRYLVHACILTEIFF